MNPHQTGEPCWYWGWGKHPRKRKRAKEALRNGKKPPASEDQWGHGGILKRKSEGAGADGREGVRVTVILQHGAVKAPSKSWQVLTHRPQEAPCLLEMTTHSPIMMSTRSELRSTQDPADRPSLNRPRREGFDKKCSSSFNPSTTVLGCTWPCTNSRNQSGPRFRNISSFVLRGGRGSVNAKITSQPIRKGHVQKIQITFSFTSHLEKAS